MCDKTEMGIRPCLDPLGGDCSNSGNRKKLEPAHSQCKRTRLPIRLIVEKARCLEPCVGSAIGGKVDHIDYRLGQ